MRLKNRVLSLRCPTGLSMKLLFPARPHICQFSSCLGITSLWLSQLDTRKRPVLYSHCDRLELTSEPSPTSERCGIQARWKRIATVLRHRSDPIYALVLVYASVLVYAPAFVYAIDLLYASYLHICAQKPA